MRDGTIKTTTVALAAILALGGTLAVMAATPEQIISERRAGYKHMGQNFKAMKDAIDSGASVELLVPKAAEVVAWAKRIPTLFPPGTETGGGTHAKPAVWTERAGFEKDAAALQAEAEKLEQAAQSGNKAAFAAQWKATAHACGTCHQTYRYKLS
jgi:cytochrome c556